MARTRACSFSLISFFFSSNSCDVAIEGICISYDINEAAQTPSNSCDVTIEGICVSYDINEAAQTPSNSCDVTVEGICISYDINEAAQTMASNTRRLFPLLLTKLPQQHSQAFLLSCFGKVWYIQTLCLHFAKMTSTFLRMIILTPGSQVYLGPG